MNNARRRKYPPIPQIRGLKREGAIAWSAIASAIVRCLGKVHRSPIATSRAAVLPRLGARRRGAGKPITASRSPAQAPQLLQVASEYVVGQIAIRRPAGVYRGNDTVRSRHSSMPLARYPL